MKIYILTTLFVAILLSSCNEAGSGTNTRTEIVDTVPPIIILKGEKNDTSYLQIHYWDNGVIVVDDTNSQIHKHLFPIVTPYGKKNDTIRQQITYKNQEIKNGDYFDRDINLFLEITGKVNSGVKGIYFLNYNAKDEAGNQAATVTRTVHVIENSTGFLNGSYSVVCSCSASIDGLPNSTTVSTDNYTAYVAPGQSKNSFILSSINSGSVFATYTTHFLIGNFIKGSYIMSLDFRSSEGIGTLSEAKNSFTIVTTSNPFPPNRSTYICKNIYTKFDDPQALYK